MTEILIRKAQLGENDAVLMLIDKFNPLLNKYAYKLNYEDAYNALLTDFIELIYKIKLENLNIKNEGSIVSYINKSVISSYIKISKERNLENKYINFSQLTEKQLFFIDSKSGTFDTYYENQLPNFNKILTKPELKIIRMIYVLDYSVKQISLF